MNDDLSKALDPTLNKVIVIILNPVILLLFSLALIVFLWGVMQYVRKANDSKERETGGQHILWGVIGMAIMLSVYGIMNLIINTLAPYQPTGYQAPTSLPK